MADFLSGCVHWWEDRANTGNSRWEFINGVRRDNERHHNMPGWFLRYSWWGNVSTTAPFTLVLSAILFVSGCPAFCWMTALFISFGNLIHRFAHEPQAKVPYVIKILQDLGVFISHHQHAEHHFDHRTGRLLSREESYRRYCVMTSWLNPVLDGIGFWDLLERLR